MIPRCHVLGPIYAFGIMDKISLCQVHCYSGLGKLNPCVMVLCCCDRIVSYEGNMIIIICGCMTL